MAAPERVALGADGPERVRLPVHARPGAARSGVVGVHGGRLKVAVRAVPEGGRANDELVAVVAAAFGLPRSGVALVRGAGSREKWLVLALPLNEAERRLDALLAAL